VNPVQPSSPSVRAVRAALASALVVGLATAFASTAPRPAAAAPLYGAWGFDLSARDTVTRPGDDFFRFANGGWLDRTQIPADRAGTSLRLLMSNLTEQRLHDLMEQEAATTAPEPTTLEGKVGAFYKAFMDSARVEQLGAAPLAPLLDAVKAAQTRDDLAGLAGRTNEDFEGAPFGFFTDVDVKDPTRYAVYVSRAVNGPRAGSWPGLVYGAAGLTLMLYAGVLGLRRRVPTWRVGRATTWLKGHLWLGLLSYALILLHSGFQLGGPLTLVLMILFTLVVASGAQIGC